MSPAVKAAIDARVAELLAQAPSPADIRRQDPARYALLAELLAPVRPAPVPRARRGAA